MMSFLRSAQVVKRTQLVFFATSKLGNRGNIMKRAQVISTAVLFLLLGTTALANAQQEQQGEKQGKPEKQVRPEKQQGRPQKQGKPEQPQQDRAQQQQQNHNNQQQERAQQQQQQNQNKQQHQNNQQQEHAQQQQQQNQNKQQQERAHQQQQQNQNNQQQERAQQQQGRLSQQRQQQLIAQQRQRVTQYGQHLDQQKNLERGHIAQLQTQNRMAQYRFQEQYSERLRQQQATLQNDRNHNYDDDPGYYMAPNYRYRRSGTYYQTNQYGVDLLRQGVNYGYQEGFQAGQADRQDRWASNYQSSYAYQDANYGYSGYYVAQDDYNYYFRQGFRRGYDDGYNSRYQYGSYSNGSYSMLGSIVSQILNLQSLR
jgi:hypothetical protein